MAVIVIVEDEALLARNLKRFLESRRYEVAVAATVAEGLALCRELDPDVALVDYNLPDGDGIELVRGLRAENAATRIVMTTAHGGVRVAVEAMKAGADDYLTKPLALEELAIFLERLLAEARMRGSLAYYQRREKSRSGLDQILGESPAMQALKARLRQMLAAEARIADGPPPPVLVLGETGTGKELIARAVHFDGPRAKGPFVELNCAAMPAHLVESELFGHERGAFTDAKEKREGLIRAADGGTLFLDEVGEMPLELQAKLLKVIEDRQVRAIGATRGRPVDVRLVAATNALLEDKVASGAFRADLYFRLAVLQIRTPPLRERAEDAALLAESFLAELTRKYARPGLRLGEAARRALLAHPWPGNVRQLRNVIEQAILFCVGDEVQPRDLGLMDLPPVTAPAGTLPATEKELIVAALRRLGGNVTLAAGDLGISRDTLRYRMERHGLRRESFV